MNMSDNLFGNIGSSLLSNVGSAGATPSTAALSVKGLSTDFLNSPSVVRN
jgi:hypothetical protein